MAEPYLIPYSRDFDEEIVSNESILVLFSHHPDDLLLQFYDIGYSIDYALRFNGIGESNNLPSVTPFVLKAKYKKAKVIVDDETPRNTIKLLFDLFKNTSVSVSLLSQLKEECPSVFRECTSKNLYIDSRGDIYPCPKPKVKKRAPISNIVNPSAACDLQMYKKIDCVCKNGYFITSRNPLHVKRVSIEFGGICSSACTYCYQRNTLRINNEKVNLSYNFDCLERFLDKLDIDEICAAGGEVLAQPLVVDFLQKYKTKRSNIKFILKTNGFSNRFELLGDSLFEEVSISLNGFSQSNISIIMGENVDIEIVKEFCKQATKKCTYAHLKFLLSPLNINDFPDFLDWALQLHPNEISVTKAMVFGDGHNDNFSGSSFKGLNHAYWDPIFLRVSLKARRILMKYNQDSIKDIVFRFGLGTKKLLNLEGY